jgi:hypothetical protein
VLIQLDQTGLSARRGAGADVEGFVHEDDPFIVVHPNYVVD